MEVWGAKRRLEGKEKGVGKGCTVLESVKAYVGMPAMSRLQPRGRHSVSERGDERKSWVKGEEKVCAEWVRRGKKMGRGRAKERKVGWNGMGWDGSILLCISTLYRWRGMLISYCLPPGASAEEGNRGRRGQPAV